MKKCILALIAIFAYTAAQALPPDNAALKIELTADHAKIKDSNDLHMVMKMINVSDHEIQLNTTYLDSDQLFIKIRNAEGSNVSNLPPPVPYSSDMKTGRFKLAPAKSLSFEYNGLPVQSLKPGKYQVRFEFSNIDPIEGDWNGQAQSEWLDFEITP